MNSKAKVTVDKQICCGHGLKGYEKAWQMCPYFQLKTSIFLFLLTYTYFVNFLWMIILQKLTLLSNMILDEQKISKFKDNTIEGIKI